MLRHAISAIVLSMDFMAQGVSVSLESVEALEVGEHDFHELDTKHGHLRHGCRISGMRLRYRCRDDATGTETTGNVTRTNDRPQVLKFQVDCRGAKFQNLTIDDHRDECARLAYRKYGNSSAPAVEMIPWIADAALRLEREDVVDIECIPKPLSWPRYKNNYPWQWIMAFRIVLDGINYPKNPLTFSPVFFNMKAFPDMGSCLTTLEKQYDWTILPLSQPQPMNYSSQLVRFSSPTLDFPPQTLFTKLGDPVYDLQVTGDIFQSSKDSLHVTVLEATLDMGSTDPEDWLVRLDPEFYSSMVEPNRFALDLKLDINSAVIPVLAQRVRVKIGFNFKDVSELVPYDLELPVVGMDMQEDSRFLIWLMVAFFLFIMVAAMSYAYREECGDFAARTFHRSDFAGRRGDEAIEMRGS